MKNEWKEGIGDRLFKKSPKSNLRMVSIAGMKERED